MIELVIVLVVISVVTTLAYPSMQSIMHRKADLEVASELVNLSHRIRAQATRRNRAYGIHLREIESASPKALVEVSESTSNLCEHLLDPTKRGLVLSLPLGQAEAEGALPPKEDHVGISGWRRGDVAALNTDELRLCYSPSGALKVYDGAGYTPLTGVLELAVQPFSGEGNWRPFGPPRFVELSYASGAQITRR